MPYNQELSLLQAQAVGMSSHMGPSCMLVLLYSLPLPKYLYSETCLKWSLLKAAASLLWPLHLVPVVLVLCKVHIVTSCL